MPEFVEVVEGMEQGFFGGLGSEGGVERGFSGEELAFGAFVDFEEFGEGVCGAEGVEGFDFAELVVGVGA